MWESCSKSSLHWKMRFIRWDVHSSAVFRCDCTLNMCRGIWPLKSQAHPLSLCPLEIIMKLQSKASEFSMIAGEYVPPRRLKGFSEERPGIAYVSNLAVERNFRRRGIGRKLLAHAIQVLLAFCETVIPLVASFTFQQIVVSFAYNHTKLALS